LRLTPKQRAKPRAGRSWLYAIAKCGTCGANLRRATGEKGVPDGYELRCNGLAGNRHPGLSVKAALLYEHVNTEVLRRLGGLRATENVYVQGSDPTEEIEALRRYLNELDEDRKAGMYRTEEMLTRYRRSYAETADRIEELKQQPVVPSGWRQVVSDETFAQRWQRWGREERGNWLAEIGAQVRLLKADPARRKYQPLAERVHIHLGALEDAADEMDALAADLGA
jgi:hypothetical protein